MTINSHTSYDVDSKKLIDPETPSRSPSPLTNPMILGKGTNFTRQGMAIYGAKPLVTTNL